MPRIARIVFHAALVSCTAALVLASTGCRSKPAGSPPEENSSTPVSAPAPTPLDPATLGDVTGIVRLAGKAPAPVRIDTSMDPACAAKADGDVYTQQYVLQGDRLANVYIYVKSGPGMVFGSSFSNADAVVLDQKGCVYVPHVIAVQVGQPVEFRNSDPTMHNIHTMPTEPGNPSVDLSEGPNSRPQRKRFHKPEIMMPVRCNNHPWMNAFINVSATPWFAVTRPDGSFELKGLPAGDYVLGAVQEKLGEQEIKVTIKPKAVTQADAIFAMK